jgi:hypothetical protein
MLTLGPLALTAPWVLLGALALPLLWWLLRATPPAPRRLPFPAVRLLFGLTADDPVVAHTPWWLILMRLVLALLILLGLAGPILNPDGLARGQGPLVLVMDDTWAAAPTWDDRRTLALDVVERAGREGRPVMLLTTAASAPDQPAAPVRPQRAEAVAETVRALAPRPWGKDLAAALDRLRAADGAPAGAAIWIHDGLAAPATESLARHLNDHGRLQVRQAGPGRAPLILRPPTIAESAPTVRVERPGPADGAAGAVALPARTVTVQARDAQGRVVLARPARLEAGAVGAAVALDLPADLRAEVTRLDIQGHAGAAAVVPLGESWGRGLLGLVTGSQGGGAAPVPLLDETHYARQALRPLGELREGSVADLLARPLSMMVMTDGARPDPDAVNRLIDWIRRGGTLVRFAGPRMEPLDPALLPLPLRAGERALGGSLSWTAPGRLAPFPADSPFAGLPVEGADVAVARQVLAEPSPTLDRRTWARLTDGTPLVTAAPLGAGRVVLVHVTADPRWSSLAMSGLFVEMLRRLAETSAAPASGSGGAPPDAVAEAPAASPGPQANEGALAPARLLDGFGRAGPPPPGARALPRALIDRPTVDPAHPPGWYGPPGRGHGVALGAALPAPVPTVATLPAGVVAGDLDTATAERDLAPWLLGGAALLALIDMIVGLALRGVLPAPARRRAASLVALVGLGAALALGTAGMVAPPARAQGLETSAGPGEPTLDPLALEAALHTRLAWIAGADAAVDDTAEAGLRTLTDVLARRTSAELGAPVPVDPARDPLAVFPLIYWPVVAGQGPPSPQAARRLNDYLRGGGMLLVDVLDGADAARALDGVAVPSLIPVPDDHVLTRSFYLLDRFPGRTEGATVWVEEDPVAHDGVSSVIIGAHDWAGAWATDQAGRAVFPTVPGGNRQREMAYRFGINVILYALTGNYKGDQVHLPAIMERLTN